MLYYSTMHRLLQYYKCTVVACNGKRKFYSEIDRAKNITSTSPDRTVRARAQERNRKASQTCPSMFLPSSDIVLVEREGASLP
jgi:hypothetical protein